MSYRNESMNRSGKESTEPRHRKIFSKIFDGFKGIDDYGQGFEDQLEDGKTAYNSCFGALCTIIVIVSLVGFIYAKLLVLFRVSDISIIEVKHDYFFNDTEQFSADQNNFFFAAALTKFDKNQTITEEERYGKLTIEQYGWGNEEEGYQYGTTEVPNRYCSDKDLGYERTEDTLIHPIFNRSQEEVDNYRYKFKCIDEDKLSIWGDYNSAKAMQLAVKFQMCEGAGCESEEEIKKWLSGKYVVLLYNQVRFITNQFGKDSIVKEARITYVPISSQTRQLIPFKVSPADIELQDSMGIELGDITLEKKSNLFRLEQMTALPYEKADNVWISLTVERDLSLRVLSRNIYTGFDFLSDIGGLQGMLAGFLGFFVGLWNYNNFDNIMVSKLYRMKPDGGEELSKQSSEKAYKSSEAFVPARMPNCDDLLRSCLPSRLFCYKKSRKNRAFNKAREVLSKEVNVYEVIQSRRFISKALKHLLSFEDRRKIRRDSRQIVIDPDSGDSDMDASVKKYLNQSTSSDSENEKRNEKRTEEVAPFGSLGMVKANQPKGDLQGIIIKQVSYEANSSPQGKKSS